MLLDGKYAFAITPLGGNEDEDSYLFHACKNPVKYLDYAGLGIPGIYSRVPVYESCIETERTGILVQNSFASWLSAMERLACNKTLRQTLRTNGFDDVKNNYHIRYSATRMEKLMRKYFD